jgi:hypothetical protein
MTKGGHGTKDQIVFLRLLTLQKTINSDRVKLGDNY